jgi:hypothetical protein
MLLLLLVCILAFFIYRSYKKPVPEKPIKLTTKIALKENEIQCPNCLLKMKEGYIPTVGAIPWRNMDQPVGMPTIFSGLPGTIFWLKRPKLHAYHCKNCRIVTFKYGKDNQCSG